MKKPGRMRRILKWCVATGCLLIAAVWAVNLYKSAWINLPNASIWIGDDGFDILGPGAQHDALLAEHGRLSIQSYPRRAHPLWFRGPTMEGPSRVGRSGVTRWDWLVKIPLWIPALLSAEVALLLFLWDRRRPRIRAAEASRPRRFRGLLKWTGVGICHLLIGLCVLRTYGGLCYEPDPVMQPNDWCIGVSEDGPFVATRRPSADLPDAPEGSGPYQAGQWYRVGGWGSRFDNWPIPRTRGYWPGLHVSTGRTPCEASCYCAGTTSCRFANIVSVRLLVVILPIRSLLPAAIAVTLMLWLLDRRRIPAGYCKNCGYNLTGNVSGVCSECGTRVQNAEGRMQKAES